MGEININLSQRHYNIFIVTRGTKGDNNVIIITTIVNKRATSTHLRTKIIKTKAVGIRRNKSFELKKPPLLLIPIHIIVFINDSVATLVTNSLRRAL